MKFAILVCLVLAVGSLAQSKGTENTWEEPEFVNFVQTSEDAALNAAAPADTVGVPHALPTNENSAGKENAADEEEDALEDDESFSFASDDDDEDADEEDADDEDEDAEEDDDEDSDEGEDTAFLEEDEDEDDEAEAAEEQEPVPFLTWDQTLAAAGKYMDELGALTEVAKCPTVAHILHFFAAFSERRPFVPARSFLWLLTYNSVEYRILNRDVLQNLVLQSLDVDYGAPFYARLAHDPLPPLEADGVPSPQHRSRELLYRWCDKSSSCIWLLLHALCSNRSRLRRKLANLFPELGAWQHHSWETDSALTPTDSTPELQEIYSKCFVLTAYTYEVVLWAMVTYLLLGCELELYKASELQGMYWYVDYLISLRFENFGNLHKTQDDPAPVRPRAGKGKKKPPAVYPALYTTRVKTRPAMQLHVVLEAHYCLARALFRFLAALPREGLLLEPASPAPLGSAAMVFNNRIKPFLYLVRPHYVRHETYLLHADTAAYSTGDLLTSASELLKRCRAVLESAAAAAAARGHPTNPALAPLLKVTKGNLVCMQLYQQGHATGKEVEFDWSASPSFPIIKFRKKAEKGDRAAAPLLAA